MPDNFNPYAEWLGLDPKLTTPNHYQLLGVDAAVVDPAAIANASDRAMTQVRSCKPGANAAAWAQLLDQISAAKTTLTDPTLRRVYDQQQQAPAAIVPPISPIAAPTGQAVDPMAPVAPIPQAAPMPQPIAAAPVMPNPMAPIANAAPVSPIIPVAVQAAPIQAVPIAQPISPVAVPTAIQAVPIQTGPVVTHQTSPVATTPMVGGVPKLKRKRSVTSRARKKSNSLLLPLLLGGSVGGLVILVVGVGYYLSNNKPAPTRPVAASSTTPAPVSGSVPSTVSRRIDEIPESERTNPTEFKLSTSDSDEIQGTRMRIPLHFDNSGSMEAAAPMKSMTLEPTTPEPMSASEPTREEIRELAKALTTARAAIGELNDVVVERELTKAVALAKLDEHKAKVARLQLLNDYLSRFRAAIDETLSRVGVGDQIEIGQGRVFGIVELTPERLVIRYNGSNRNYPRNELPAGLANRLAEMSLDKTSPDTAAMKAAFVSVNPRVDDAGLAKAKTWWDEAASIEDVPDLLTAINDDYSLRQSIGDVTLEASVMEQLAAVADRLKDATTIEAFAKEYQAAIDESLKTLEPDTELSIGGSTTVTIKELKSARIMLVVAGDTRGFRFDKLPLGLAAAIAERTLPRDAPLTLVMKGAYFAARDKDQTDKQFRPQVMNWWKQAFDSDEQLQPVVRKLVAQYPK